MGLPIQISDISSDSIFVIAVVLVGKGASYLNSVFLDILHRLGLFRDDPVNDVVGSGLTEIIALCNQLNRDGTLDDTDYRLCGLSERDAGRDHVRRLTCRHVFHKDCFDGWPQHLNFTCPLCHALLSPTTAVTGSGLFRGGA